MTPILSDAVLGLACDRGAWPEVATGALDDGAAAIGAPVLGPLGLLRLVETALGVGAPEIPHATRLAAWRAKLAAAAQGRFWADSFAQDPLATAEALLRWRDGLVEAGWDARATQHAPRLADLAAAEASEPTLPAGVADRLCSALTELAVAPPGTPVAALRLLDARATLPPAPARLVDALEARGTVVSELAEPLAPASGDLGKVQAVLRDGGVAPLDGDGTFALLTAETETAAAEALADWLAAGGAQGRTVIVADRPTGALDAALARRYLPALGVSRASAQRGVLQLLPLVLATRWKPFDAARMLQLLQARPSPIPHEVRHALSRALVEAPGRGGSDWAKALAEGRARLAARLEEEQAKDPTRLAAPRLARAKARIALLLEQPLADPSAGMPVEELRRLCGALATWAAERAQGEAGPLFVALLGAARVLAEAAQATGREALGRVELERLLAAALDRGLPDPEATEQAAPWVVLRDPAGLWDWADTVVWWGLGEPALPPRRPWTQAEAAALASAGCAPADPAAALAALVRGWRRPLLWARKRALLVAVPEAGDAHARRHPLLDELRNLLLDAPPAAQPVAERLLADPGARLMGTALPRVTLAPAALPQPRAAWGIPERVVARREVESASSIETLLGCAYAWVATYAAKLRAGRAAEVPDGSQLAGLVAHRLAQEIFRKGAPPAPGAARAQAEARLPALLEEMAAPLLAPGAAAERAWMLHALPRAMEDLAVLIAEHRLEVLGTEAEASAEDVPERGQRLAGRIDMLLSKPDGGRAVLDLKWSAIDRWRRAEIEEGRAIQLATYVGLAGAGEDAAFFMLAQRRALATGASIFGGPNAPSLRETWQGALEGRHRRMATIAAGTLRAIGVGWDEKKPPEDPDEAPVRAHPACRFCDFGRLCGKEELR